MEETKASLEVAKAELARMKAGAWQQQIAIAQAQVEQARDTIAAIDVRLSRLKVLSPIAGTVIKRNIEPGEYTGAANMAQAAMVVGDVSTLHIRAQVNEEDVVEVQPGDKGMARTRGAFDELIPLTMLRIEPLAIPKRQLTGIPSEQVDTRVVEIIFQVQPGRKVPLYPGQLVDVYIQTQPE
jgi:multidrug efflux pump subunit AcrA (membrane-fusion protein)